MHNTLIIRACIQASKGVYHDGHDRADVQKYLHEGFLPRVRSYLRRTRLVHEIIDHKTGIKRWEEVPPELEEGEKEVIWINQDESLFYANDDAGGTWLEADKNYIEMKGGYTRSHCPLDHPAFPAFAVHSPCIPCICSRSRSQDTCLWFHNIS